MGAWLVVVAVAVAVVVGLLAIRRAHTEIEPTIEAFARSRAALAPRRAELDAQTASLRSRLDERPGPAEPHG